jgi:hypothetical protein
MKSSRVTDVFLSYSQSETAWAAEVQVRFGQAGLEVFNAYGADAGDMRDGVIWDALVESSALIALVRSPREMSPTLSFEIGAAMTWQKPVYVLYQGDRPTGLPKYAEQFGMFPASELDKLVRLVAREKGFSDEERHALQQAYTAVGVPADRLLVDLAKLDELEKNFKKISPSHFSAEQLLREILRLRKQRKLPRVGIKRNKAQLRRRTGHRIEA